MNNPRKRAPTIRDVAQAAGVSTATVSKFVNGSQRFSLEVEARISQAVTQLGWSLNPMARGMNTGLSGNKIEGVPSVLGQSTPEKRSGGEAENAGTSKGSSNRS